jgi:RimJ/RimL family protein N-acetyltransferase
MVKEEYILKGEKTVLRFLSIIDINQTYLSWLHDDEVMAGLATSGYTIENLHDYVYSKINDSTVAFFAICDSNTNEHIGNVKLDFYDAKANVAELGILIGNKNYWGKGIAYEACKLAIQYGFDKMNLRKIYLAVYESNPAAKKVYEKLGFVLEGTLRKHVAVKGEMQDKYLMGLFKNELK